MGSVTAIQIGIDIGQKRDPTAIAVTQVEETEYESGDVMIAYTCRFLERMPLGTPYPRIAERLGQVAERARVNAMQEYFKATGNCWPPDYGFQTFVDATGVGQPVVDLLRETGLDITECYFTHGDRRTTEAQRVVIGKAWLVSRLQALLQARRLRLPGDHPEAGPLRQELLDYEIKVDQNANDRYGAFKTGTHDDLVTAVGLATQVEPGYLRAPRGELADYLDAQMGGYR